MEILDQSDNIPTLVIQTLTNGWVIKAPWGEFIFDDILTLLTFLRDEIEVPEQVDELPVYLSYQQFDNHNG